MTEPVVVIPDSGQPPAPAAPATPAAPVADSAPAAPAAPESVAPGGAIPASPASGVVPAPPASGDSAPAGEPKVEQRVANAQRMMHAATTAKADLEKQLADLGVAPVTRQAPPALGVTQPPSPVLPPPAVQQPPAAPAIPPSQVPAGQAFSLTPEQATAIHKRYTEAPNDEAATGILVEEVANLILSKVPTEGVLADTLLKNDGYMQGLYKALRGRVDTEQRAQKSMEAMNTYFQKHAPNVPLDLIWNYAEAASAAKPGNLAEQALYMLERAVTALNPLLGDAQTQAQTNEAIQRGQGAVLPGGSGLPAAGGDRGPAPSFVEQLQRANQGV